MSALHCIQAHLPVLGGAAVYTAVLAHIEVALLVSEAVRFGLSVLFSVQLQLQVPARDWQHLPPVHALLIAGRHHPTAQQRMSVSNHYVQSGQPAAHAAFDADIIHTC